MILVVSSCIVSAGDISLPCPPGRSVQQVGHHQEASVLRHVLLYRGRRLHHLADEAHQRRTDDAAQ